MSYSTKYISYTKNNGATNLHNCNSDPVTN